MCSLCLCVLKEEGGGGGGGGGDEGFVPQQLESIFLTPSSTFPSLLPPPSHPRALGMLQSADSAGFCLRPLLKKKKKKRDGGAELITKV